jgi:hypothetical protein
VSHKGSYRLAARAAPPSRLEVIAEEGRRAKADLDRARLGDEDKQRRETLELAVCGQVLPAITSSLAWGSGPMGLLAVVAGDPRKFRALVHRVLLPLHAEVGIERVKLETGAAMGRHWA